MDKNKYPWTKAENEPDGNAGTPEETGIDFPEPPPAPPPGQTLEKPVYAGPEFFGSKRRRETSAEGVYAGPEFFRDRTEPPVQAVYAAPLIIDRKRRPRAEKVYAGPEWPKNIKETEMNEVYAGPEYFGGLPDEPAEDAPAPQFMMVYAAPGFFPGQNSGNAGSAGQYCERCGTPVKESYNFCPECGAPLTKKI